MAGLLYGVNPFNQPGVELGKRLTYGALGKRGFETEGEEIKTYLKKAEIHNLVSWMLLPPL